MHGSEPGQPGLGGQGKQQSSPGRGMEGGEGQLEVRKFKFYLWVKKQTFDSEEVPREFLWILDFKVQVPRFSAPFVTVRKVILTSSNHSWL